MPDTQTLLSSPKRLHISASALRPRRAIIALLLLILAIVPGQVGDITRGTLYDAFLGVSVFVAATLALFYGIKTVWGIDISTVLKRSARAQVPLAALFGVLPGCGGAVVVVAAYASGHVRMGAVVATLTATMGDAAFLLIATRPDVAAVVLPISFIVAILTGYLVDLFHHQPAENLQSAPQPTLIAETKPRKYVYVIYIVLALMGLIFGILDLAQVEFGPRLSIWVQSGSLIAIALSLMIWATSPTKTMTNADNSTPARVAEETSFITIWVIGAFLLFEYADQLAGLDLASWFNAAGPLLPLIAILIGFIPGCGPQILVTTLYINGLVPFAALIGNAIANDGDALFPAIAIAPKAAIWATLYSAIPAFFVAYGFYFIFPHLFA